MNLFKKSLLTLFVALLTLSASAQKVITFESTDSKLGNNKARTAGMGKNAVSVGLVSWINGYTPVYFERSLLDMISVQVGAGITTRSFWGDVGNVFDESGASNDNYHASNASDIVDDYTHYKYRSSKPGAYFSLSPKVYYQDEGMDGNFIAPMIEYKLFRYAAQKADVTVPVDYYYSSDDDRTVPHSKDVMDETVRCIDFSVNYGGTYQSRNHVVIGWSTGLGVRSSTNTRLDIGIVEDENGVDHFANATRDFNKTKLFFSFNVTVGGWF